MKIGITGNRSVTNREFVFFILKIVIRQFNLKPTHLKSGGADGVDKLAEAFFRIYYKIEPQVIRPDYKAFKGREKLAPKARNGQIVEDRDYVIAILSGDTPKWTGGTWDAIEKALNADVPVILVDIRRGLIQMVISKEQIGD